MFPDETRRRQEMLSGHIYELSAKVLDKEMNEHLKIIQKMQMIYKDGFKHSYSDFFPVVSKIFENDKEYSTDYLVSNLETIRETLEIDYSNGENQFGDIYSQFTKLCDHLNLQISEMIYFRKDANLIAATESVNNANKTLADAYSKLSTSYDELEKTHNDLIKVNTDLNEANERAKSLQTELIAVLSIFAAIVLTFAGEFSLLASVMTSIENAKYYEMVVLCALICGLIMFNTIFLLMYLVSKITTRNIYARCKTDVCSCAKKCSGLNRIRKRLPYVFYFNVFCIIGIAIDCFVWYLDIIGKI